MITVIIISFLVVLYTYGGYGLVIYLLNNFISIKHQRETFSPPVSMIIACYNEEKWVEKKFYNIEAMSYPSNIEVIWVTDGSTDKTNEILNNLINGPTKYNHQLLWESARKGKTAALNRSIKYCTTDFIFLTDCNTMTNKKCVEEMMKNFYDPQVGAVSGQKEVVGAGEGLYWKYENFLKAQDSMFWTQVGTPGELFAIRKELYKEPEYDAILDDFMISMRISELGYRVILEKEAIAVESGSPDTSSEWVRKRRIAAGGIQSIIRLDRLVFPWTSNFRTWFQYVSHRVLRWTLAPLCYFLMPILATINIFVNPGNPSYIIFGMFFIFYLLVVIGRLLMELGHNSPLVIPYYFTRMNWCVIEGWKKYLTESGLHVWTKIDR